MRDEVLSAAKFITDLMRKKSNANQINSLQLEKFCNTLQNMLQCHYHQHWFPTEPSKGSGYRCIRNNHKLDPILSQVGKMCGFSEVQLLQQLPNELTMWVDPREVSYRIGENGSICVLYDGKCDNRSSTISQTSRMSPVSSSSEDGDISPMSTSPPTISYGSNLRSCKSEFYFNGHEYIMDARNLNLMEYVLS